MTKKKAKVNERKKKVLLIPKITGEKATAI